MNVNSIIQKYTIFKTPQPIYKIDASAEIKIKRFKPNLFHEVPVLPSYLKNQIENMRFEFSNKLSENSNLIKHIKHHDISPSSTDKENPSHPTVKDLYRAARFFFEHTTGASEEAIKAQNQLSHKFLNQDLNIKTAFDAANKETVHMLSLPREKQFNNTPNKLATLVSYGGNCSIRNVGIQTLISFLNFGFRTTNDKDKPELAIHKLNLIRNPQIDFGWV